MFSSSPQISVIIPAHNPHPGRLERVLLAIRAQTYPADRIQTILVDNASSAFPDASFFQKFAPANLQVVREPQLGLTAARRRGFTESSAPILVLVDDDNVLAVDYLEKVLAHFSLREHVGATGGKSLPEFELKPAAWANEFFPLLALRDLGSETLISKGLRPPGSTRNCYPAFAPIGAGLALRREAAESWLQRPGASTDRRGTDLSSSGDNEIVLVTLESGWEVSYSPELALHHLIPEARLHPGYLARLNHGIQKSWTQVLLSHDACPWPVIPPWTVPLRKMKAWFTYRGWRKPAGHIRWQGACGHFEGRASR